MLNKIKPRNVLTSVYFILILAVFIFGAGYVISDTPGSHPVTEGDHPDVPPDVHDVAGDGYHVFQFDPPFNNNNPYTAQELQIVAEGLDVFLNEDFDGNGRACGTCHIPSAQYNILPKDFEALTDEEKLLVLGGTNAELENAEAVKKFALFNITELHGLGSEGERDDPVGPFRGSMPLLSNGLGLTTLNFHVCDDDVGGLSGNPNNFGHELFTPCNKGPAGGPAGPGNVFNNFPGLGYTRENHDFPGCTENDYDAWPGEMVCVTDVPFLHAKGLGALPNSNGAVDDGTRDVMLGWNGAGALIHAPGFESQAGEDLNCENTVFSEFSNLEDIDDVLALFAFTAVRTHFPITQGRTPGVDFRCPTIEELEAIALHNKWLGRRYELDITELDFVTSLGNEGRDLFLDRNSGCAGCHINAGANDNQGRLKLGPFDVLPPLTDDQVALATYECPEEVHCVDDSDCVSPLDGRFDAPDYNTCEDDPASDHYLTCVNDEGTPYYFDDLVSALDELMPRSGMGANKTSRSGTQFLEPLVDNQLAMDFPFDLGDGELRSGGTQGGFNIQPVIQAVMKTNGFHNHAIEGKFEEIIAHYFTPNFDASQGGNAINNSFRCGKGGPASLAALGGADAIDKIGYFARNLFAVYAIADAERFLDEAGDRLAWGIGNAHIPLEHAQFVLSDAVTALEESNIQTPLDSKVIRKILRSKGEFNSVLVQLGNFDKGSEKKQEQQAKSIKKRLEKLRTELAEVRNSIATTPEIED